MRGNSVVLHGRVRSDGTLQIDEKVNLPPGPVQVTVEVIAETQIGEDTRSVLQRIRARRQAREVVARSKEEIDAEIDAMRNADEQAVANDF